MRDTTDIINDLINAASILSDTATGVLRVFEDVEDLTEQGYPEAVKKLSGLREAILDEKAHFMPIWDKIDEWGGVILDWVSELYKD